MKDLSLGLAARLAPLLWGVRGKQRLSILIYHRVLPQRDPMRPDEPTVEEFEKQMRLLRRHFTPLSLAQALQGLRDSSLPERAVCVTFDDGYADNETQALAVLNKYAIPATVFVSTGFLNGGRMWNDSVIEAFRYSEAGQFNLGDLQLGRYDLTSWEQRHAGAEQVIGRIKHLDPQVRKELVNSIEQRVDHLPDDLMMTDEQVRSLAHGGVTIGAHTVNHPILASAPQEIARREIADSKRYLETLLQAPVDLFAYPNGKPDSDYRREHRDMVEELGFKAAVSTQWGVSSGQSDPYQLPRFTPWDKGETRFALRLLASYRWLDPLIGSG